MRLLITKTTLCMAAATLVACGKPAPGTPTPSPTPYPTPPSMSTVAADKTASAPTGGAAKDASLPAAETVLTPATATKVDPAAGRSNKAMTNAQESSAMPLPGQNNDHSAPLPPAKRASSP